MSLVSFHSVPKQKLQGISNNEIKNLYSKFVFLYFSFKRYKKQEGINIQSSIEKLLYYSLKDFKFITVNLNDINQNNQKLFNSNVTNEKSDTETPTTDINAYFCCEDKFIIVKQINILIIKTLIEKLKDEKIEILNVSENINLFKKEPNEINAKNEIKNFCQYYQAEINKNKFIKSTISPIIGYTIRRFFYPNYFFKDSSFFDLYRASKSKEEMIKTKLFKLLFECKNNVQFVYQFIHIIQEINMNINNIQGNATNIIEFKNEDFIKLRTIYTNQSAFYYLVIHRETFYIFLMKDLCEPNKPEYEIDFCNKYSNRCFTRFYGFIKQNRMIKSLIYEFMCNNSLNECKDKFDSLFSLFTINRLYQGIRFLYSKNLIHRDLKPKNILLDNNFIPYISDFETIRHPDKNEQITNNIGSILYSSPEQDDGDYTSFPTDIYSFGLIIHFLYKKNHLHSLNPYEKNLNRTKIKIKNSEEKIYSKNIEKLFMSCIKTSPEKRPNHNEIKSMIVKEINTFDFFKGDLSPFTIIN